jgi:hypothetical protein
MSFDVTKSRSFKVQPRVSSRMANLYVFLTGMRFYDAKTAEADAAAILAGRADEVLRGPRDRLGPPWTKDHRTALAATILTAGADTTAIARAAGQRTRCVP